MADLEGESLNSLIEVFLEWNDIINNEDIDFDSLPITSDYENFRPLIKSKKLGGSK